MALRRGEHLRCRRQVGPTVDELVHALVNERLERLTRPLEVELQPHDACPVQRERLVRTGVAGENGLHALRKIERVAVPVADDEYLGKDREQRIELRGLGAADREPSDLAATRSA